MSTAVDLDRGRWAPATRAAYGGAWKDFTNFCRSSDAEPLPATAETVAAFIRRCAPTLSTSTISQRLAAIRAIHKDAKGQLPKLDPTRELYTLDDPQIADAWTDVRRTKGTAKKPKAALTKEDIRAMLAVIPASNLLERSLTTFMFTSLLRRSEAAALDVEDLQFQDDALIVTVRRSKGDKLGKGERVAVARTNGPHCPVAMLERYLESRGITEGAIYRNSRGNRIDPRSISESAKKWAAMVGRDAREIGAHSYRHGGITELDRAGVTLKDGMAQSRHKTPSVYQGYVEARRATLNPALDALRL